ncbi:MAG: NADP-dependent 3-hydroxy acid dehydrogenase YdfG [Mycobacterium sp.]|jgi:NAD(P)-dependent dehydrogenase (short-subunit alcohol dehydrogenase family)|uniref:SDR family NAD(P)-dependent oxidoreductase n=1 Tax=Mycobacterium sp. TaxID=1785 RepID=UPI00261243B7|nr:SDR family NAD(P)-dependent oxidoreductase [Mycobacterium sp.]MCW2659254.1 NADP-dependent 3-hydroxy acid dehydrogenase YdfG [Mycobacterium sp.]
MAEQVWFVTGASRGLGRSVVGQALGAGHRMVGTARRVDALSQFGQAYPGRFLALPLDVTDAARARWAVGEAVSTFGRLDVVVNNAGYANMTPIEEVDLDDFRSQFDAVFLGTVYVTKAALPVFRAQNSGHFIQVTSIGGRLTSPGLGAYQAAKFAVEGFSGVLAQEVAGFGIKVTLAEPGAMRTDWAGSSMVVPQHSPDYAPTVGAMATRLRAANGTEPIDPDKVARAFVQIAELNEPPLHLLLGSDAVDLAAAALQKTTDEDRRWAQFGRSVDFGATGPVLPEHPPAPAGG